MLGHLQFQDDLSQRLPSVSIEEITALSSEGGAGGGVISLD